jgi:hypothetical protein
LGKRFSASPAIGFDEGNVERSGKPTAGLESDVAVLGGGGGEGITAEIREGTLKIGVRIS